MKDYHPSWKRTPDTIKTQLALGAKLGDVRDPTFTVLNAVQRLPADKQIIAIFAAGVLMATAINSDPHELIAKVRRMLTEATNIDSTADVLGDYARGELA